MIDEDPNLMNDGFDIFSGIRHWWQDNITNNQKLMGGLGLVPDQRL
jgi:hypothetical protein